MAITQEKDPKTKKTFLMADGKVGAVSIKDIANPQTYTGKNGPWTPTKRYSVAIDEQWISLGLGEKDTIRVKDVDGTYMDLAKGMEVSLTVVKGDDYNGKPQYSGKASDVVVVDASGAESAAKPQQAAAGGKSTFKPRDETGVVAGNARTAAYNFFSRYGGTVEDLVTFFASLAHNMRIEYGNANPNLDAFQVGVSVGQAITTAASAVNSLDDVEAFVQNYLDEVIPMSVDVVKGLTPNKAVEVVVPGAAKKPAKKNTSKKVEPPVTQEVEDTPTFEDFDDDIPFN
jgi:hypothetical protein